MAAVAKGDDFVARIESANDAVARARAHMAELVFGQPDVVDHAIITLLAGGHALVIGLPGLAKTRLARCLGTVFGLVDKRIQFTPDLMPSDIVGSEVLEEGESGRRAFRFMKGRCSVSFCLPTRSTVHRPGRSPHCFRPCRRTR